MYIFQNFNQNQVYHCMQTANIYTDIILCLVVNSAHKPSLILMHTCDADASLSLCVTIPHMQTLTFMHTYRC